MIGDVDVGNNSPRSVPERKRIGLSNEPSERVGRVAGILQDKVAGSSLNDIANAVGERFGLGGILARCPRTRCQVVFTDAIIGRHGGILVGEPTPCCVDVDYHGMGIQHTNVCRQCVKD